MGINEGQPAAAPPVEEDIVGQSVEFRLVDDLEVVQGHFLTRVQHHARFVRNEEPLTRQLGDKGGTG
jgi:hypothetical protein